MNEVINNKYPIIPTILIKFNKRITLLREMVKVIVDNTNSIIIFIKKNGLFEYILHTIDYLTINI